MTLSPQQVTAEMQGTKAPSLGKPRAVAMLQVGPTLACLADALKAVGQPEFYSVLASKLCPLFGCGRYLAMHYSRNSKPTFLVNRSFSQSAGEVYLHSLYEQDPLYRTVLHGIPTRVLTLQSACGQVWLSDYRNALLQHAQISDELAILLPILEETAVAVCFNQGAGCFDAEVVALAEAIYPIVSEANRLHLERWSALEVKNGTLSASQFVRESRSQNGDRQVLGQFCDLHCLSAREGELLRLMLEGLSSAPIAHRLNLALGTVKNYKRRLYSKLRVCSERAVLRMVADFLTAGGGSENN
jgi:DNA-binding CsgD family transcriptional regulator